MCPHSTDEKLKSKILPGGHGTAVRGAHTPSHSFPPLPPPGKGPSNEVREKTEPGALGWKWRYSQQKQRAPKTENKPPGNVRALQLTTPTPPILTTTQRRAGRFLNSPSRGPLKGKPPQLGALSSVGWGRGLFVFSKAGSWGCEVGPGDGEAGGWCWGLPQIEVGGGEGRDRGGRHHSAREERRRCSGDCGECRKGKESSS